ncbi:HAD family hydrolase [Desulfuromonas acetoxidans]|uniref:3-deoxy-D-manno-octulosonate 8-phosphate phosphatase KdsC n=1 Tax=Desulfuromonas acetoxidans (strain DSM 684 / 11070) TaxID=281689 RepID=Q1K306_DESA6|nr:HAD-IIIA family hydrolase [Desulfuromonas acetoxidans]EAT16725.1 Phosphatase kdsC [Desulfuromonas acetoxidans DSM 684]MBF0644802.1 HAD-IIIA family hydrolase [Desulfuromonas acetoxidans]NVD23665.1 HAD-IIIA family hydrolase [Desulfuromonas acetoxidans]NVE15950.1 HAD-IIIA family hydrolase [Desulfuromonas acetoxidans]
MKKRSIEKVRLLLLDVDGVLTDGRIIYDNNGIESKAFHVRDGHGLKLLQRAGIKVGIITGRSSEIVSHRAAELGIDIVYQGAKTKLEPYEQILADLKLSDQQVAYVGDDLVDLPILRRVGCSFTVADAVADIKPYVDYITTLPGGHGAVREVCDMLLRQSGLWDSVTDRYFD